MWQSWCWLTANVVHICLLLCPLIAADWIGENCREGSLQADPDNRAAYYQCLDGQPYPQICPDKSYFDPKLVACVFEVANCREDELKADLEDCKGYYQCINGDYVKLQCANGSFFNPTINICVVDVEGNCDGKCIEGLLIESPDDCAQYFECIAGKFVQMKCPSGSYFNADFDSCVIDENGICPTSSSKKFIQV